MHRGKTIQSKDGSTYALKAKLKRINQLKFRGYLGISLLGKTMKITRVK
ncbi:DUF2147 domain-containing protein [Spirosoma validum]|uniref:DUF2147 domain-containing protein n=1 Tax=Spirosoma validum TaxID=2771355 RepID=A0A927GGT4_9BACT|nr:DUF2147 domain-containing protein [Spirosoma validum]